MELDYKVKIYPAAKQDLLGIIDYLNTLSHEAALRYYDLLTGEIVSLRPRDLALSARGFRYLIIEKYLVFYKITGDTVQIHRILYGKRNYQALL